MLEGDAILVAESDGAFQPFKRFVVHSFKRVDGSQPVSDVRVDAAFLFTLSVKFARASSCSPARSGTWRGRAHAVHVRMLFQHVPHQSGRRLPALPDNRA